MDSSLLGFGVLVAVLLGSGIFLVVRQKLMNSEVEKAERHQVQGTVQCPHCSSNLQSDLDKITHGRASAKKFIKLKCSCGAQSTWDMHGNPPVMSEYTKPPMTNDGQPKKDGQKSS